MLHATEVLGAEAYDSLGNIVGRVKEMFIVPDEQPNPEFLFQPADLMTDRGLRDAQCQGRAREAQMPGGGLERPEPVQRRQPRGHFAGSRCMSLSHLKRYEVSFVERPKSADIHCNRLAFGGDHVHLHT